MPGNRNGASFGRMFVLPVAAAGTRQFPAVRFDDLDRVPDLHSTYSVPTFVLNAMAKRGMSEGAGHRKS